MTLHELPYLSALECAYLQTFPRGFRWGDAYEKWGTTNVREMIGEAVPPRFTELHGYVLKQLLCGKRWKRLLLPAKDKRFTTAAQKLALANQGALDFRAI